LKFTVENAAFSQKLKLFVLTKENLGGVCGHLKSQYTSQIALPCHRLHFDLNNRRGSLASPWPTSIDIHRPHY
jgi:hypothetical protein